LCEGGVATSPSDILFCCAMGVIPRFAESTSVPDSAARAPSDLIFAPAGFIHPAALDPGYIPDQVRQDG